VELSALPLEDLRRFSSLIEGDALESLKLESSLAARDHPGGTAPRQVRRAIEKARRILAGL
jgi:argininosuccinate lyase